MKQVLVDTSELLIPILVVALCAVALVAGLLFAVLPDEQLVGASSVVSLDTPVTFAERFP